MTSHFSMGAINKSTNTYEYPIIANKLNKYECPSCERDVILKKGKIKKPHFAHYKTDNPCHYYDKPSESQIHKDAKMLMQTLLNNKQKLDIYRQCSYCVFSDKLHSLNYTPDCKAVIEHKFEYNNSKKSADVALVDNNNIIYLFEICYKHKTNEENRPEPWIEIDAELLIRKVNNNNINTITCIREYKCKKCIKKEEYEIQREREEMIKNIKKIREQHEREIENNLKILQRQEEQRRIQKEREQMGNEDLRLFEHKYKEELLARKLNFIYNLNNILKCKLNQIIKDKENEALIKQEKEILRQFMEKDKRCSGCNINYCKCVNPKYIKNEFNRFLCNNCCKYKCHCIKITNFFNNNKV